MLSTGFRLLLIMESIVYQILNQCLIRIYCQPQDSRKTIS